MSLKTRDDVDVPTPEEILSEAKERYKVDTFCLLFSGGKDSLVAGKIVEQAAKKLGVLFEVLHCKTGIGVKENFEYVLTTCNSLGWKLNVEIPEHRFSYDEIIRRWGFPGEEMHSGTMRWLKWFSIRRFNRKMVDAGRKVGFISGTRMKESSRRGKNMAKRGTMQITPNEHRKYPIHMIAPLYYWSTEQVWAYLRSNKIEICPVYQTLHISGDCMCGCFAEKDESRLLKMFHPETAKRIAELEKKYGGKWGYGRCVSMTGVMQEKSMEDFVCAECFFDRKTEA